MAFTTPVNVWLECLAKQYGLEADGSRRIEKRPTHDLTYSITGKNICPFFLDQPVLFRPTLDLIVGFLRMKATSLSSTLLVQPYTILYS
jgi:hypothetical protein